MRGGEVLRLITKRVREIGMSNMIMSGGTEKNNLQPVEHSDGHSKPGIETNSMRGYFLGRRGDPQN